MRYKDVSRVNAQGRRSKWSRIKVEGVSAWINAARKEKSQHIFTTIQTFLEPQHRENEEAECDFYADFDGETAINDVAAMGEWFVKMGLQQADVRIWFSGKKGFHLVIPAKVFGALSSPIIHKYWKTIGTKIAKQLDLKSWDSTVYSCRRMWRVENTIHGGSGLYKIPLTLDEVEAASLGIIKQWAAQDRVSPFEEYEDAPIQALVETYDRAIEAVTQSKISVKWEANEELDFDEPPPCIKALLERGVLELHTVNAVAFRLAAFFKSQGLSKVETTTIMNDWVFKIDASCTDDLNTDGTVDYEKIRQQVSYILQTVYAGGQYGFSCEGILQIEGLEKFCTEECKTNTSKRRVVTLFDAYKVENMGHRIWFEAEAVGLRDTAMAIPEEIKVWCRPTQRENCAECPLLGSPDGIIIKIKAGQFNILELIEPSNMNLTGRIGQICKLPPKKVCPHWKYSIKDRNCEVVYLAPRVANAYETEDRYTRRMAYYFGHGLMANQGYLFSGYVHKNTRNNALKLVIDKAEPLADSLSDFEFTKEMQKESEIFRPVKNQSMCKKHDDIVSALNYHYCRVWGRELLIKAFDIAYHSVNKFWFQKELINGWIDILIIGDTRQGKTKVAETLMKHYDLGIRVSGESASRTGLLFTIATSEKEPSYIIWGVLPRHSKRLVVIDEIKTLVENKGFAELTEARSAGRVAVTKTVFGQALSETRCIWMTNTRGRKPMKSYFYPVLALPDLIPDGEDISRFTYAIGVASNEIDDAIINIDYDDIVAKDDTYKSSVCHNHLLWIWNLKPEEIHFTAGVEKKILRLAYEMCQEYTASIPLVEPGDLRHKLARVAIALAARMDSRKGTELYVTTEAVKYAFDLIDNLYSDESLRYLQYSEDYATYAPGDETLLTLEEDFKGKCSFWEALVKWFRVNMYTKPIEFASVSGFEVKDIKPVMVWLAAHKFLEVTSRGSYRKTEVGVGFFEALLPMEMSKRKSAGERLKSASQDLERSSNSGLDKPLSNVVVTSSQDSVSNDEGNKDEF